MARILYFSHDNPRPSGGVRTLYRHVEVLRGAGFDAYVVHHQRGFRTDWFKSDAPVLHAEDGLALAQQDWAVIPEDHTGALEGMKDVRCNKAIFCQGHYLVFEAIPPAASWRDYGVTAVLASSEPIREFVRSVFNMEAWYVPLSIDPGIFRPGNGPRKSQVAFMPRKGAHHLRMARGLLHHRAPELRDVAWAPIEGYSEQQVAALLAESAFFVASGYHEGFGLPPLEAMACGCIVVGFRAGGGVEYSSPHNGFWVGDEDTFALADALADCLRAYKKDADQAFATVRSAGYATAARYAPATEASRLSEFWASRISRAHRAAK